MGHFLFCGIFVLIDYRHVHTYVIHYPRWPPLTLKLYQRSLMNNLQKYFIGSYMLVLKIKI